MKVDIWGTCTICGNERCENVAGLLRFDTAGLSPAAKLNCDTVLYMRESAAAIARFDLGGSAFGPSPYVVSRLTGAYQSVPATK